MTLFVVQASKQASKQSSKQSRWSRLIVGRWKCRFYLGGNHIPSPTATKNRIISTVAALKPFKSGLLSSQ